MRPLAFVAAAYLASFPTCQRFHSVVVAQAESGRTLELRHGQEFGVRLNLNADPNLRWHLVDRGGAVMISNPVVIAGSGTQLWRFRANGIRGGVLRLVLRPANSPKAEPVEVFTAEIKIASPR